MSCWWSQLLISQGSPKHPISRTPTWEGQLNTIQTLNVRYTYLHLYHTNTHRSQIEWLWKVYGGCVSLKGSLTNKPLKIGFFSICYIIFMIPKQLWYLFNPKLQFQNINHAACNQKKSTCRTLNVREQYRINMIWWLHIPIKFHRTGIFPYINCWNWWVSNASQNCLYMEHLGISCIKTKNKTCWKLIL